MAVFLLNVCKFNGCGLTYPSLGDLIQHIEESHIECEPVTSDFEPLPAKQHSASIPMSSALRFYTNLPSKRAAPPALPLSSSSHHSPTKCSRSSSPPPPSLLPPPPLPPSSSSSSLSSALVCSSDGELVQHGAAHRRANSVGSTSPSVTSEEMDEPPAVDSEDSNDSWTTQEEFSAEFIMRYGSKPDSSCVGDEKPYACPVPGCTKRYKNINGIKYHAKNGHKKDSKIKKMFKCHCGKNYKTNAALRSHALCAHPGVSLTAITTASGEVLLIPSSQVTTLQPVRVSLNALVNGHIGSVPLRSLASGQLLATSFKDCLLRRVGDRATSTLVHTAVPSPSVSSSYSSVAATTTAGLLVRSDDNVMRRAGVPLTANKTVSVQLGVPASSVAPASTIVPLSTRIVTQSGAVGRTASFRLQPVAPGAGVVAPPRAFGTRLAQAGLAVGVPSSPVSTKTAITCGSLPSACVTATGEQQQLASSACDQLQLLDSFIQTGDPDQGTANSPGCDLVGLPAHKRSCSPPHHMLFADDCTDPLTCIDPLTDPPLAGPLIPL